MADPELHFFAANDINGSTLLEVPITAEYFEQLGFRAHLFELGYMRWRFHRKWGINLVASDAIKPDTFVRLLVPAMDPDEYQWGCFLDDKVQKVIAKIRAGENLSLGGVGPKQYLDRAALWPEQFTATGWNIDLDEGVFKWAESATAGKILNQLINEAQLNTTADFLPDLTKTFTFDEDSDGSPWANEIAGSDEFQVPIGQSLLQTLFDLESDSDLETTVYLGTVAEPRFRLDAHQSYGRDLLPANKDDFSPDVVNFREGVNIESELENRGTVRRKPSHVIVHGLDDAYAIAQRPGWSLGEYAKSIGIESPVQSRNEDVLERVGLRWIRKQDNAEKEIRFAILPGFQASDGRYFPSRPSGNGHFWIGDTVGLTTQDSVVLALDFQNDAQRVTGITGDLRNVASDDNPEERAMSWNILPELNVEAASDVNPAAKARCCRVNRTSPRKPPVCDEVPAGAVENVLASTDTGEFGTPITSGGCWGGVAHHSAGSQGHVRPTSAVAVSPGDTVFIRVNFRDETGDDAWENNTNYDYDFDWKFTDSGDAFHVLHVPIFDLKYFNVGCHNATVEYTTVVPAGFDGVQVRINGKLGGTTYRIEAFGTLDLTDAVECPPGSVGSEVPQESGTYYTADAVDYLIAQAIANVSVGRLVRTMRNNSGDTLDVGAVVVPDTSTVDAVTTTSDAAQTALPAGVVLEGGEDQASITVLWYGRATTLDYGGATPAPDDYVYTSATPGQADLDSVRGAGALGVIAEDAGEIVVYWWGVPDMGGGGGATALDDLIDVNAPSPADDDVLTWDAGAGEWVAAAPTGGGGGGTGGPAASDRVVYNGSNITTTSTSFVDAGSLSITLTTGANRVMLALAAVGNNSNAGQTVFVDFEVDGTRIGNDVNGITSVTGTEPRDLSMSALTDTLSAGSHTFKVKFRVTANTGALQADGSDRTVVFSAHEVTGVPDLTALTSERRIQGISDYAVGYDASAAALRAFPVASIGRVNRQYTVFESDLVLGPTGALDVVLGEPSPLYNQVSAGNTAVQQSSEAGHIGIVRFTTGTSTTGRGGLATVGDVAILGSGKMRFLSLVRITTLSDGTQTFTFNAGLGNAMGSTTQSDGITFRYGHSINGGKWQLVTDAASSENTADSGVTVVAGSWYLLEFEVNAAGTSVEFFINGTSVGTISATIPTATMRIIAGNIVKSAGSTARTFDADAYRAVFEYTTAR